MANIIWLDDRPNERLTAARALERTGHTVNLVASHAEALSALKLSEPDLIIQDLHRDVRGEDISGLPDHVGRSPAHEVGWAFYEHVLRSEYPWLPVVICTLDAGLLHNLRRADDFNLDMVRKGAGSVDRLSTLVDELLAAQKLILAPRNRPSIAVPEFQRVNLALVRLLRQRPGAVHRLTWAGFEELVARLLQELGYEVSRTKLTRDGGVDIWALRRDDLGETLYAIDAKKYAADSVIGPEPVRAIYGVADLANATAGMIVTTATFGSAARELAAQHRYRIGLKDYDAVQDWIERVGA